MENSIKKSGYTFGVFYFLVFIICINVSCKRKIKDKAQLIVDSCIVAHGGLAYNNLNINFKFRDKVYKINKKENVFEYQRIGKDSTGQEVKDIFNNKGLERFVNGKKVELVDSMATKYKNSINSVVYFTMLPQPLNDDAVMKTYLGETTIGGQKYDKIKVTFKAENGGKDHDDEYIYWINKQNKFLDYFAYSYKVDGGGIRFRERIGIETVSGIRFQNYINYEPTTNKYALADLDKAFVDGNLRELSRIVNENLKSNK